jgi:hypothetical protein
MANLNDKPLFVKAEMNGVGMGKDIKRKTIHSTRTL